MKHPKSYDSTPEIRKRMGNVRLKNGKAETLLAKVLWHKGYRYRRNYKKLPGSPDIAITTHKIAVFVDGEFWHGENWEERKAKLKHNREYWIEKIEENIARDKRVDDQLIEMGWIPIRPYSHLNNDFTYPPKGDFLLPRHLKTVKCRGLFVFKY